jgi:recombinational DNA repair protein RecR
VKIGQRVRYRADGKIGTIIKELSEMPGGYEHNPGTAFLVKFDDGEERSLMVYGLDAIKSDCPECLDHFQVDRDYLCDSCREEQAN